MNQIFNIVKLLHKKKSQSLSETEKIELEAWSQENSNYKFLERIMSKEHERTMIEELDHYNANCAHKRFLNRTERIGRNSINIWWKIAVVVILLLSISITLFVVELSPQPKNNNSSTHTILASGNNVVLTLETGQQIVLGSERNNYIINDHKKYMIVDSMELTYKKRTQATSEIYYNEIYVPRKGEYALRLSDGSRIYLNSDTKLKYPVVFEKNERRVTLEGEAYFEIAKDSLSPFVVTAGEIDVQVVGTTFNIKAYKEEKQIVTTLISGKVRLKQETRIIDILPDEQVYWDKEHLRFILKKKVNTLLFSAWKDGLLKFERERLKNLTTILERWYDVEFIFEQPELKDYLFTGDLKKYDNMESHLRMLEMTTDIQFITKGNIVQIRHK